MKAIDLYHLVKLIFMVSILLVLVTGCVVLYQWTDDSPIIDESTLNIAWQHNGFDGIIEPRGTGYIELSFDKLRECNYATVRKVIVGDTNTDIGLMANPEVRPPGKYEVPINFQLPAYLLPGEYAIIVIIEYKCNPLMAPQPLQYRSNELHFRIE